MLVGEAVANAQVLSGKIVKIEGILIQEREGNQRWYIAPTNAPSITDTVMLVEERLPWKPSNKFPSNEERLDAFFNRFLTDEFKGLSKEQAQEHYIGLLSTGAEEHLDAFIMVGAGNYLADIFSPQADREVKFNLLLHLHNSLSLTSPRIQDKYFYFYPSSVIGKLDVSNQTSGNHISLVDIAEITVYREDLITYIKGGGVELDEINFSITEVTEASRILANPNFFLEQMVRVNGLLLGYEFIEGSPQCFIVPNKAYLRLKYPHLRGIRINSSSLVNKMVKNASPMLGGKFGRIASVQIVGKITLSDLSPFPLQLTDINEVATKEGQEIFRWRL